MELAADGPGLNRLALMVGTVFDRLVASPSVPGSGRVDRRP